MNHQSQQQLNNQLTRALKPYSMFDYLDEARQIRWRLQDILAADDTLSKLTLVLMFLAYAPGGETNTTVQGISVHLRRNPFDPNIYSVHVVTGILVDETVLLVSDTGSEVGYTVFGKPGRMFEFMPSRNLLYYGGGYSVEHFTADEMHARHIDELLGSSVLDKLRANSPDAGE